MIRKVKYLDRPCLNLTCIKPGEALNFAKTIVPVEFNVLRVLQTFNDRVISKEEVTQRINKILDMVREYRSDDPSRDVTTIWLRPLPFSPFFNGMLEDALLCEGYKVVYSSTKLLNPNSGEKPQYKQDGWWEIEYE